MHESILFSKGICSLSDLSFHQAHHKDGHQTTHAVFAALHNDSLVVHVTKWLNYESLPANVKCHITNLASSLTSNVFNYAQQRL